jgi:hypothetical protein
MHKKSDEVDAGKKVVFIGLAQRNTAIVDDAGIAFQCNDLFSLYNVRAMDAYKAVNRKPRFNFFHCAVKNILFFICCFNYNIIVQRFNP